MSSLVLTKRPLDVMADLPLAYALDHNCVFAMVSNQVVNRSVRYLFRIPAASLWAGHLIQPLDVSSR
jgi:hypothetical protein